MRTRSGFEYNIESDESDGWNEETPTASTSLIVRPTQPLQPFQRLIVPTDRAGPIERRDIRPAVQSIQPVMWRSKSMQFLKMCGNGLVKIINSMSTILTAVAGVHAVLQVIHPPEHNI